MVALNWNNSYFEQATGNNNLSANIDCFSNLTDLSLNKEDFLEQKLAQGRITVKFNYSYVSAGPISLVPV